VWKPDTVDQYIAHFSPEQQAVLKDLRAEIRSIIPDAMESISYGQPAFKYERIVVWYAAFKDHFSIFPATEAVMKAGGNELEPFRTGKGTISFTRKKPLPDGLLRKIVEARVKEAAEGR